MAPSFNSNFPSFKSFARINSLSKSDEPTQFFDCKFYPYTEAGVDPVFAVVGKAEAIVCRPPRADNAGIEVIAWFHDDDANANLNSCTWSQDLTTGDPLLCVAGQSSSVRIFNVRTKKLIRTLIGHGKEINDLAVSPLSPSILASASMDYSVRFWSLDSRHYKQPCMLICGGEGHREGLLTLAFHTTGRFLLTGGMDNVINLWVIPELPNKNSGTDKPTILHYPHFSTSAIHTSVVDCITWYRDLIISKCAAECKIVLWRIENFDSSSAEEEELPHAPTTHEFRPTRSAFGGTYQRLLQFEAAETTPFYVRFSLFTAPQARPILAIGNEKSKIFFWDLQSLEHWGAQELDAEGNRLPDSGSGGGGESVRRRGGRGRGGRGRRGGFRRGVARVTDTNEREGSIAFSAAAAAAAVIGHGGPGPTFGTTEDGSFDPVASRLVLKNRTDHPFRALPHHKFSVVPKVTFASRQVAWSVGGEWMVVVGDQGMIALFAR